jgi:hypothetical protein
MIDAPRWTLEERAALDFLAMVRAFLPEAWRHIANRLQRDSALQVAYLVARGALVARIPAWLPPIEAVSWAQFSAEAVAQAPLGAQRGPFTPHGLVLTAVHAILAGDRLPAACRAVLWGVCYPGPGWPQPARTPDPAAVLRT